jgi:predicted glycogen debranching enzyme
MSFITFDKDQLINLEYSLKKEMLRSNRAGSFSCTTIIGCNTRKYHGLLICPQPILDNERHVLLSKLDETVIQREAEFNIGISKYPGTYNPKGHKYVRNFIAEIIPVVTYRVGGVVLTKETLFVTQQERVMIRYTLVEAQSPTTLRIKPFLAFRNIHQLSKKNIYLDTKYESIKNGIKTRMYEGYSHLYMQLSKSDSEYIHAPDWFNDIEYYHEMARGYDYLEDLYVPGFFEFPIKKGESVIFSAGTQEVNPSQITRQFNSELKNRTPRNSFDNSLVNSAEQFFYKHDHGIDVIAGYPWYDRIGRYTFMALPGLFTSQSNGNSCEPVIKTMIAQMKDGFFPETGRGSNTIYGSADTSLWFIWALSQCTGSKMPGSYVWENYNNVIRQILESYLTGNEFIEMTENHLLYINKNHPSTTWMNAVVEGMAVTPRYGFVVEVNALWYNAMKFALQLANEASDKSFVKKWTKIAERIPESFQKTFWNEETDCLLDYVADEKPSYAIRPNQIIAASVPFSPVSDEITCKILDVIIKQLLTPKGLRSLSPQDSNYKGRYEGDTYERDRSLHQGTVWPWLMGHFTEAYLRIYKSKGVEYVKSLYHNFEEDMIEDGIGTIGEFYEGDPPHQSKGAISFAPSVGEILRMKYLIEKIEKMK